jgi:hypothetical protein
MLVTQPHSCTTTVLSQSAATCCSNLLRQPVTTCNSLQKPSGAAWAAASALHVTCRWQSHATAFGDEGIQQHEGKAANTVAHSVRRNCNCSAVFGVLKTS